MARPREYRAYLCDVEGVLVRDKRYEAVPGSVAWFNGLAARGIETVLVSNNTTHAPQEVVADLRRAGFDVTADRLVTALELGTGLLARWGKRRLLWLGDPRLASWWRDAGFALAEPGDAAVDAVVLGAHAGLTAGQIEGALPGLLEGEAELVALHRNLFWLDGEGRRRAGPGVWCAALATLARREPVVVGKPHERIYRAALKRVGAPASEALFISDDPEADLVTARRLGMGTAFVLSGKHADHAVLGRLDQEDWPDIVCDRPELIAGDAPPEERR